MGVKDLWNILQPYAERKPLFELENKTVAIDLAGWVVEAMHVLNYEVQPRFYLRNLFFRTTYLLLAGVTPVYVLEGSAPALKYGVICQRVEAAVANGTRPARIDRHNGLDGYSNNPKKAATGRGSFNRILKQCEEMLSYLGVQCVQGPGEAEAFCAQLNRAGLVDGVISQDSDCFAYGARRVYRNFSVASQGRVAAQGGAVDVYDMERIERAMDFGQNKMIAMALLCGCDYCPDGVPGVGRDQTIKFFSLFKEHEVLDRLKEWRTTPDEKFDVRRHDRVLCNTCGHLGTSHWSVGCEECGTEKMCRSANFTTEAMFANHRAIKCEMQIRRKALVDPAFPSQAIIDEFMELPCQLPQSLDLSWKQPNVAKFMRMMLANVQWNEAYSLTKILPVLTRWQLFHLADAVDAAAANGASNAAAMVEKLSNKLGTVQPDYIKKKRTPKGIASYEIVWKDPSGYFDDLVNNLQVQNFLAENRVTDPQMPWSTIEPVDLVEHAYPQLVEQFQAQIQSKKKPVSRRVAYVANLDVGQTKSRKRRAKATNAAAVATAVVVAAPTTPDPLRANSKTSDKTPVMIDRFLQRLQAGHVKKSARKAAIANGVTEWPQKATTKPTKALHRKSFLSPRITTSDAPLSLSVFVYDEANHSMSWTENALDYEDADLSAVIGEMAAEPAKAVSFCGRRLRFEAMLHTSDVHFVAVTSKGDASAQTNRKPVPESPEPHNTASPSSVSPKALKGRPVDKLVHTSPFILQFYAKSKKTCSSSDSEDEQEKDDPWQSYPLTYLPIERPADKPKLEQNSTMESPLEKTTETAETAKAEESIDEFDRLVLAGSKGSAFTKQQSRSTAIDYIGSWSRIVCANTADPPTVDDASQDPVLQVYGDPNAFVCYTCKRLDPLQLHQCTVLPTYDGNIALMPPPNTPTTTSTTNRRPTVDQPNANVLYDWGLIQSGELWMRMSPTKRFSKFFDYWRHQYDLPDYNVRWYHRLQHPPDMAMYEFHNDLLAKRSAALASSTPNASDRHHRSSRHNKRRSDGELVAEAAAQPPLSVANVASPTHVVPKAGVEKEKLADAALSQSFFFQVSNDTNIEWNCEDAVDYGTYKVRDDFEMCSDLWNEPDVFKPHDADLVSGLYDTPGAVCSERDVEAARKTHAERTQSYALWQRQHGELKRDTCDQEVRYTTRGKVLFSSKLVEERSHNRSGTRLRGLQQMEGVLMVGAMTPSVLAAEQSSLGFRVESSGAAPVAADAAATDATSAVKFNGSGCSPVQPAMTTLWERSSGLAEENSATGANDKLSAGLNSMDAMIRVVEAAQADGIDIAEMDSSAATPTIASLAIASTSAAAGCNDSLELNGSYVPVSKKLRNILDLS